MDILEKLQEIFRDVFDDEEFCLTREASPEDIEEWDSLAQINIISACETEFGVKFSLNDITSLKTAGDLYDLIEVKLKK